MPKHPGKLSLFWQELKRRKVIRVISVYAAAAFVILELTDIVSPSLGLPDWTLNFIIVLLCVGFLIAVILSWIYDVNPEGGLERTLTVDRAAGDEKKSTSNGWRIASYVSLLVIIFLIVLNVIPDDRKRKKEGILDKSIAVLPFENLSLEEGNEHFVDGLVEDLLNRISVIEELKVISRTSSEMYRERGMKSVPEIASELGVAYILEGSVQRYGNKARITVQLIDAVHDDHLWAKNYDRNLEDVFKTQSEIALRIVSELNAILTSRQEIQIQESGTKNIKAFELYQLGRFHWNKRTKEGYLKSLEYFDKAIETDPDYALAYAGKADTYNLMAIQGHMDALEGRDKAVELAMLALEQDENLAEAYTVLGSVYDYLVNDWEKAEKAFQRALELNPNYSTAHHYYAEHLSILGKHKQARRHIDLAIELDPLQFVKRFVSAKLFMGQNLIHEALEEIDRGNELHEDHPWVHWIKYQCYWKLGDEELAYDAFRKYIATYPDYDIVKADSIYKSTGFNGVLEWEIKNEHINAERTKDYSYLARLYAMDGQDDNALFWLQKGPYYLQSPEFTFQIQFLHLHQDPRYLAILEKLGLDKYPVYGQEVPPTPVSE